MEADIGRAVEALPAILATKLEFCCKVCGSSSETFTTALSQAKGPLILAQLFFSQLPSFSKLSNELC